MRILFFGCDDFAARHLAHLIEGGHEVVGLVTQPDRPRGRGLHVVFSPTKQLAMDRGIPVLQPETLRHPVIVERLAWFHADMFVVIAYGQFLPENVLALPRYFCLNVHASLLPRYRGAAPVNWAVINGETRTGVTLMKMDAGMDTGDIIAQEACVINEDETAVELRARLAALGAGLLSSTLPRIREGAFTLTPQDGALATRAPKMHKDLGHIDWSRPARAIHDLVRGLQPWPGAFTFCGGRRLKVLEAVAAFAQRAGRPGEIVELHKDGFYVQAGDSALLLKRVHPESSHAMDARAFLAGHRLSVGDILQ